MAKQARLDKEALFKALGYKPHPGQQPVHDSRAKRRVLACGVRFGKSMCAAMEAVAAMMEPREQSLGWIVAPNFDLAERVFQRVVSTVQAKLKHRIKVLDLRERRLTIVNLGGGISEVRAKSADNPDSLLGEGLDWLIVDEATRMKAAVWSEFLSQRLVDRKGWALLLSTPQGKDWFYRLFARGQGGRDRAYESWSSPSWANPHLDAKVIEEERSRLPPVVFAEQYEALFLGGDSEPCARCGGPSPYAPRIVMDERDRASEPCPECGEDVNEAGNTVVPCDRRSGRRAARFIISGPSTAGTTPMLPIPEMIALPPRAS